MAERRGPAPLSDDRLAIVRREAGAFGNILADDALGLLARLDLAERRIAAALRLCDHARPGRGLADDIAFALRLPFYPDPTLAAPPGDARGASPAEGI